MSRTPSVTAHEKALDAAIRLIEERGIEGASMDAIAQLSGVSKATLYKHWKDKEALCIDVIVRLRALPPEYDSDNPRRDLTAFLRHLSKAEKSGSLMKIWPRIIGYAVSNPNFAHALQEISFEPRRAQIRRILRHAIARDELLKEIDLDLAMDLLIGPIMHRRFTRVDVPGKLPGQVVDAFWRAWGTGSGAQPRRAAQKNL